MSSELKSETARANGAKSRGPKTPEGKQTSSRNSITHGFTAHNTLILQCESPDEFQKMLAEHIAIHQPVTPPEKELVDQMAAARWRIRRFIAAETVLIDSEMVRNRDKVDKEFAPADSAVHLALAIRSLADESRSLSLMSRYESRLQRIHDRAYTALRELQQSRATQPTPTEPDPPSAPASAGNPSVSAGALSAENKKSPNEPTVHPDATPGIHLCTPVEQVPDLPSASENSEDYDG